jgi:GMP synthase-like glutamine amidotransferase
VSQVRLGVLECDHVSERYLPIAGDYADMFTALVAEADPDAEVVLYDARRGMLPTRPDECDGWLCTGSSASVFDDEPWIDAVAAFVRDVHAARVPFVGICFGHQLIAHALGGRTERAAVGWGAGAIPMQVAVEAPWMTPPLRSATLLYSHQDQVTELPPGGRVLGSAPHCPIAMLAVEDDIIGIQAHPEFGAPYVRALLEDRVDRIGAEDTTVALESLERSTDERVVARWILEFLRARLSTEPSAGPPRRRCGG